MIIAGIKSVMIKEHLWVTIIFDYSLDNFRQNRRDGVNGLRADDN